MNEWYRKLLFLFHGRLSGCLRGSTRLCRLRVRENAAVVHRATVFDVDGLRHGVAAVYGRLAGGGSDRLRRRRRRGGRRVVGELAEQVAERAAAKSDYVRFGYTGALDGKPLADVVADKAIYAAAPQTWEEVEGANEGLLPGMSKQLAGLKAGDKKDATVTFPAEFAAVPALAGKTVTYAIEVQEVRERVLPPLDEKFFKENQADDLAALKSQVATNLKMRKEYENRAAQRRQVTDALVAQANFPVPDSLIASERDGVLRQFIEENMRRGIPQEQFEQNKKELYDSATKAAISRVKVQLMLAKIADAEKLKVDEKDFNNWIMREAMRSSQRPDKLAKDLGKDREQLRAIQQQLLFDKALDFLVSKATVKTAKAIA